MEIAVINRLAKREVIKTSRFTSLIKTGKCSAYKRTSGDTSHSVDVIKQIAYKYVSQTARLAKELLDSSLSKTVQNNYGFLYSHFQYEADPKLQHMRSPICSWADRFNGIDCKSFSIFASTLLLNQNIGHYIRRIKQASYQPDYWTHVYIIVPIDQKSLSLENGYYIIDGTMHRNSESSFIEKEDTKMSKLPHVWLNGSSGHENSSHDELQDAVNNFNQFLEGLVYKGISQAKIQNIHVLLNSYLSKNIIPNVDVNNNSIIINGHVITIDQALPGLGISLGDLSGVFGSGWSPSCFNGTYSKRDVDYVAPIVVGGFNKIYKAYNDSLSSNSISTIEQKINAILSHSQGFRDHTYKTSRKSWNSSCSKAATRAFYKMGAFYQDLALKAFFGYISNYFTFNSVFKTIQNVSYKSIPMDTRTHGKGMKQRDFKADVSVVQVENLQFKGNDIPFFETNPYALENVQEEGFNLEGFINTLSNVAIQFQDHIDPNNTGGNQNGASNNPPNNGGNPPKPSQAGFGLIEGLLVTGVIGGVIYAYSSSQNNNPKSKSNAA